MKKELSPGKRRGLQACATNEGIFAILALDHRDSLRAIIAPAAPQTVTPAQLTEVKLSVIEHLAGAATEAQDRLVRSIAADCERYEMPFFLEPISYSIQPDLKKDSPEFAAQRRRIIVGTVRRLSLLGPDVMKVEFPLDARYDNDPGLWADACAELTEASLIPWTLLSAGESFATFKQQLQVACRAGTEVVLDMDFRPDQPAGQAE